jgi:DHA3 family tetracycline resistance protein-like MFS transporter
MKRLNGNTVFLFQEFTASLLFAVIFTVSTLYQVETVGLNPFQLVLVGTLLELTAFVAEVPTGIIADVYSRRLSIIIGFVLVGLGFIVEGSIPQFWAVLLAQVIWGIGITCTSGALEAWIADEVGEEKAGKAFLRGTQFNNAGALVGILISVLLGTIALNIPILVGGVLLIVLAGVLALIMPETGFKPTPREDRNTFQHMGHTFRSGVNVVRTRRVLVTLLVAAAFFGAFSEGLDRLWIPHLVQFTLPYFEPVVWVGIIGSVSLALGIIVTEVVNRRVDTNNQLVVARALQIVIALVMALTLVYGLAWNFTVALVAILALKPVRGMNYPLSTAWMNQHVEPAVRATVFSIRNQADAFGQIIGGPILGAIATLVSLRAEMVVAALFLVPALYLYSRKQEVKEPGTAPAESAV